LHAALNGALLARGESPRAPAADDDIHVLEQMAGG
jgi:hypothetical protein